MYYLIYKITCLVNEKIYVGAHKTHDLNDNYMGSGRRLKRAQKKYGIENFRKEILAVFFNPEDMFNAEAEIVNEEFVSRDDTYNVVLGGETAINGYNDRVAKGEITRDKTLLRKGGLSTVERLIKHSKEHAEKLKTDEEYRKEFSEKVRAGVGAGNFLGKKHSIKTREKMSESHKGKHVGNNNNMFGKCWVFNEDTSESKSIPKEHLNDYLAKGWQRGRKIKKATT